MVHAIWNIVCDEYQIIRLFHKICLQTNKFINKKKIVGNIYGEEAKKFCDSTFTTP